MRPSEAAMELVHLEEHLAMNQDDIIPWKVKKLKRRIQYCKKVIRDAQLSWAMYEFKRARLEFMEGIQSPLRGSSFYNGRTGLVNRKHDVMELRGSMSKLRQLGVKKSLT